MTATLEETRVEIRSTYGTVRLEVTLPTVPADTAEQSWSGLRWAIQQTLQDAADWVEAISGYPLPDPEYNAVEGGRR